MCTRWVLTVASEMNSCLAMARLPSPVASSSSSWISRGGQGRFRVADPAHQPGGHLRGQRGLAGRGRKHRLADLLRRGVLEHVAAGSGLHGGEDIGVGVVRGEDEHRRGGCPASPALILPVAVTPSMPAPICRSISTTSTGSPRVWSRDSSARAAPPSAASATTVMPSKSLSMARSPARTTGWSSTSRTRMSVTPGFPPREATEREPDGHHRSLAGGGLDVQACRQARPPAPASDRSP